MSPMDILILILAAAAVAGAFIHRRRRTRSGKGGGCGGCMMELSENEKGKLTASGICECPNCGRLVYKV